VTFLRSLPKDLHKYKMNTLINKQVADLKDYEVIWPQQYYSNDFKIQA